jgi:hypothetical protein
MTFKPKPGYERQLKKQIEQNLGPAVRGAVRSVKCPDHPDHDPPDVVRDGDDWQIVACCKRGAELAAKAAGLGEVTWRTP